jgi:hypothetical protein
MKLNFGTKLAVASSKTVLVGGESSLSTPSTPMDSHSSKTTITEVVELSMSMSSTKSDSEDDMPLNLKPKSKRSHHKKGGYDISYVGETSEDSSIYARYTAEGELVRDPGQRLNLNIRKTDPNTGNEDNILELQHAYLELGPYPRPGDGKRLGLPTGKEDRPLFQEKTLKPFKWAEYGFRNGRGGVHCFNCWVAGKSSFVVSLKHSKISTFYLDCLVGYSILAPFT